VAGALVAEARQAADTSGFRIATSLLPANAELVILARLVADRQGAGPMVQERPLVAAQGGVEQLSTATMLGHRVAHAARADIAALLGI